MNDVNQKKQIMKFYCIFILEIIISNFNKYIYNKDLTYLNGLRWNYITEKQLSYVLMLGIWFYNI